MIDCLALRFQLHYGIIDFGMPPDPPSVACLCMLANALYTNRWERSCPWEPDHSNIVSFGHVL